MKYRFSFVVAVAFVALLCGRGAALAQSQVSIKLAHAYPTTHIVHFQARTFKETLEARLPGRVEVTIYPGGQLYRGEQEAMQAVATGAIQAAIPPAGNVASLDPGFLLVDLPFLITNPKAMGRFEDSDLARELLTRLEKRGMRGLAFFQTGTAAIFNTKMPIRNLADFKGLRIRVPAGKLQEGGIKALGASSISLQAADVVPSLQSGLIDGVLTNAQAAQALKISQLAKNATITGQQVFTRVLLMNARFWAGLAPDVQKEILAAAEHTVKANRDYVINLEEKSIGALKNDGVKFENLGPAEIQSLREATKGVYDEFADQIGKPLIERALKLGRE